MVAFLGIEIIKAWKDWEQSDAVQIIKTDGNAVYTHLCNVKLCAE